MMLPGTNGFLVYTRMTLTYPLRGTKGDNGSAKDLGGAKKVKDANGKEVMEVELPTAREDVDSLWAASRNALRHKPAEEKEHRDAETKQADRDRNSRTNVVLTWIGTNMYVLIVSLLSFICSTLSTRAMIIFFTSSAFTDWVQTKFDVSSSSTFNPYLTFLFYAL